MSELRDITELKKAQEALRQFADIFRFARIGIAVGDAKNMLFETVNPAYAEMHGHTVEELIGRPIAEVYAPQTRAALSQIAQEVNEKGHLTYKTMHMRKDGNLFPVEVDAFGVRDEKGNLLYQIATVQDITERKKAEDTLRESESRFRAAIENLPFDFWMMGKDGRYIMQNPASIKNWGDVVGKAPEEVNMNAEALSVWQDNNKRAFAGEILRGEVKFFVGGEERFFYNIISPVTDGETIKSILGINIDITERKRSEEVIREREEKFRNLFEYATDAVYILSLGGNVIDINSTACERLGYTKEEMLDTHISRFVPPKFAGAVSERMAQLEQYGQTVFESAHLKKDGTIMPVEVNAKIINYENRKVVLSMVRDITERKKAEEALREVNDKLNAILQASPAAIYLMDDHGIITMWNKAAERMFGWSEEEAVGRPLPIVPGHKHEEFIALFKRLFNGESLMAVELRRQKKDSSPIDISLFAAPVYDSSGGVHEIMSVVTDITLRKKMEEDLIQKEKLESIGILAGGIAHDFNNLLTAIVGNISMAKMLSTPDSKIHQRLVEAEKASFRAKDLTQQLLTFSKGGEPIKKATSIHALLKDSVGFVLRGTKSKADISAPDDLWPVEADEGQISQVIHNIILNADQSMSQGGIINVRCENVVIENEKPNVLKNGRYVKIAIQDHGLGIPKGDVEKIFDPYFTTKQRGSGLGLATSYSIIKKHDGHIRVESELGVGTTFHVYLPASGKQITTEDMTEEKALRGKGKILIMDDEELVSAVAGEMLRNLGYQVELSSDGDETIERYKKAKEDNVPFDIVIMDLTIQGGMGGADAIKKLREMDPNVKAIVSSGYSNDPIMSNFTEFGFKGVITKPYRLSDLSDVVNSVMTRS